MIKLLKKSKKASEEENVLVVLKEHDIKKVAILGAITGVLIFAVGFLVYKMFFAQVIISDDFSSFNRNIWHYVSNTTGEESYNAKTDDGMLKIPKNTIGTEPFIVSKTFMADTGKTISINRDILIKTDDSQSFTAYFVLSSVSDENSPQDLFYIEYINSDGEYQINICVVANQSLATLETLSFHRNEKFNENITFNTATGTLSYSVYGDKVNVIVLRPKTNEYTLYMFSDSGYEQGDMLIDNITVKTS